MRGMFDDEDDEPERGKSRRDSDLTLGSGALLGIFFVFVVICGLCFGLGYSVGHHASPSPLTAAPQPSPDQEPLTANASIPKPSAADQAPLTPTPQALEASQTDATGSTPEAGEAPIPGAAAAPGTTPTAVPAVQNTLQPANAGAPAGQPVVHPALEQAASPTPAGQPTMAGGMRPAYQPAQPLPPEPLMVQIAAVSNPQDAEVLVGALRERGYPVTVRRNLTDNLIHVRIGPFASRELANQWRMKLLNDGYNAVVQP
jgi:DedD protein